MRPELPAAVLWDMDGTLVDSEKVWTISLQDTARKLGGELSAAAREAMVGSNMARTMDLLFADLGLPPDPDHQAETAAYLSARTAELFAEGLVWRPGAHAALTELRATGLPMALVTNTERDLTESALDVIGRHFFDVTVCGDEVPRGKPDPDPYLRAAELLGVPIEECLAVEDSPTGTRAAESAGAAVLVVPCETTVEPGPARVLRDSLHGLTPDEVRIVYDRVAAVR
ncbi:haloacid dehalogenase superfamily, subfamily IA, variant 3 with third motif having DD or ED/haloacid dehalogenase superfamily, subfamily IA, variant 1 with third motif having Dx(3-4)D or Dx(3-4)E [Pseudonocardia thermophila]|uniref:Haloacid dehalogenase superfamily, subfamily IA, variant 3 with third motif having DD or ED/haloacid dehalogenase superfamily, subfamily IA, variant 1 with third motif having Dx(3-4)D or Dx(3-4)E n=1 Tax=Pseudonocardia thermophila TaxID=1848 RepID=A0A1M6NDN4_PSETH|nr:HAD family phosphatase [Pseudonocardia thermophila]SHJ93858.1 haloacid dehalogenase superfamily, subfamily IA, variant 3 with third motif having DD or ED/haloacid dehalogenase superfamily, subfamily IA, variant 1 with third motif having Dx(3-4)D or Dx(3-4)E [Pseudonocardia thermophila]